MKIELKFWQSGPLLTRVAGVIGDLWQRVANALNELGFLVDPERCPEPILRLIAYQRSVDRLPGEDLALFRRRVKHAFENALDAGSVGGFERIWERLDLGTVIQRERVDEVEWDVIEVEVDPGRFAPYQGLFEELVRLYGRTCRRYVLTIPSGDPIVIVLRPFEFGATYDRYNLEVQI